MAASFGMASYFVNPYAAYAATNGSHVVSTKMFDTKVFGLCL
jgi:hypothetical protein